MTLSDFLQGAQRTYDEHGATGFKYISEDFLQGVLGRAGLFVNFGGDHMEQDWDVLVLLDACRADLMAEVAAEYDFIQSVGTFVSHASHSREWIQKSFLRPPKNRLAVLWELMKDPDNNEVFHEQFETKPMHDTAYVTWNHFSRILDDEQFYLLDAVWKYAWDDNQKFIEPRPITDRTIDVARNTDAPRVVAHYMQPHTPFKKQIEDRERDYSPPEGPISEVFQDEPENALGNNMSPYSQIQRGHIGFEEVWEAYKDNLRWVLDDIELLVQNVDGTVVISSDHGNAIGEWGCYGHRPYVPVRAVKSVPWVELEAVDHGTHDPEWEQEDADLSNEVVRERLEDLGYV